MTDIQISAESGDAAALAESARFAGRRRRYQTTVRLAQALIVFFVLLLWQFGGGILFDAFYLGSPRGIGLILLNDLQDPLFYRDIRVTGTEMALGYGLGASLGIAFGGIFARWRFVADVFDPFFVAFNSIPRIALAPLLVIWFGIDTGAKVVLAATLVFFVTFFSTLAGIRNVDSALINVARVLGVNEWQLFFKVQLPASLSWIINGLRLSLPFALIGVIVGEFLVASSGLGYRLNMYSTTYNTNGTFAMIIVMMVFMMCLNGAVSFLERKAIGRAPAEDQSYLHA